MGVKIFTADIIYHLFDQFTAYLEEIKNKKREAMSNLLVYPAIGMGTAVARHTTASIFKCPHSPH